MQNDRPIQEFSLQLTTELESLEDLLEWFEKIALEYLGDRAYWQCQLALTEGFTNAVRHAHENLPPTTPIDLKILLFPRSLEIQVWDCGQPFDLEAELRSRLAEKAYKLDGNLTELAEGGRGLVWMSELMDDLSYIRTANRQNCLVLRKYW
ncbi:MAG: ATP-binding protein [Jaaginema sp. PMC 1079.18]|nr:ATP-binding protein [Jaaginema sp. PMC 1080.18]MEC4852021.1 ATP-binding protein [Jaaginema sp. PMC 1079.18]MEC4866113.1 ATP-binding protein [Jaaginema sp. PMC 1078.18]